MSAEKLLKAPLDLHATALNLQKALASAGYFDESLIESEPEPIKRGHPVYVAWEEFTDNFQTGMIPSEIRIAFYRLRRLTLFKSSEALEAAESLNLLLARYTCKVLCPELDGPIEPCGLRYLGIVYDKIQPTADKLLKLTWSKNMVSASSLVEHFWSIDYEGDSDPFNLLNQKITEVNKVLRRAGYPYRLSKKSGYVVWKSLKE
ncbi:hypothetical protein KIH39_15635 [Telmatocola sphagniphila]|uniref:Uncharacterized protein n=1 Tax=Telmatocola sphagniphila TaxID=1123043 RepID=A0A8E6B1S6_9BACT|nr:hypothetical protein [Telmatocola sphagniphila]QVL30283.1 hypothetical protein KIH39_15635 [Telmatocola sphagniphila]